MWLVTCIIHAPRFTPEQAPRPRCGCCQTCEQVARQSVKHVKPKAYFNDLSEAHGWTPGDPQVGWAQQVTIQRSCGKNVQLEQDSSLGLPRTCGCRHLIFCQHFCKLADWKLANKSELVPASASTTWGWTEGAQTWCHLLSVGWGKLSWVPCLDLGGLAAPWILSSFQGFFSSWT